MRFKNNLFWIFIALFTALLCRSFLISVHKIPTVSMAPTLWPGDFIMSSQIAYGLRFPWSPAIHFKAQPLAGDLIIFQFNEKKAPAKASAQYVKRIVGLAGDEIEIQKGHLIINGKPCSYSRKAEKLSVETFEIMREECNGSVREIILSNQSNGSALSSFSKSKVPDNEVFVLGDNRDTSDDSRNLGTVPIDQIASKVGSIWLSYGSTQDFISGPNRIRWNRILTKPR